eukprot:4034766-Amphidinium_carterae.1
MGTWATGAQGWFQVLKPRAFVCARDSQPNVSCIWGLCCLRKVKPDPMGVGSSKGSAWSN